MLWCVEMSWMNWACVGVVVLGFVLFLIGANVYSIAAGFAGIFFFSVGVIGMLVMYIYGELTKKAPQNP